MGETSPSGTVIPLALSRQDIADMVGTTIETAIRIMSRWGKEGIVRTERTSFVIENRAALEKIASEG
jgi:CRP/FNR family transcriptional regulator